MYHLLPAFQKLMVYKSITQKIVFPMYNLLEYNKNYRKTTGSLWNYYRDQPSNPLSTNSESFEYKTSITGNNLIILALVTKIMTQIRLATKKQKLLCH